MRLLTFGFVSGGITLHISQADGCHDWMDLLVASKLVPVEGSLVPIEAIEAIEGECQFLDWASGRNRFAVVSEPA